MALFLPRRAPTQPGSALAAVFPGSQRLFLMDKATKAEGSWRQNQRGSGDPRRLLLSPLNTPTSVCEPSLAVKVPGGPWPRLCKPQRQALHSARPKATGRLKLCPLSQPSAPADQTECNLFANHFLKQFYHLAPGIVWLPGNDFTGSRLCLLVHCLACLGLLTRGENVADNLVSWVMTPFRIPNVITNAVDLTITNFADI